MKTYYKVVRRKYDKLVSCAMYDLACIEYVPDKWIKAPKWLQDLGKGPLIFASLDNAKTFISGNMNNNEVEIWEVKARCVNTNPRAYRVWDLAGGEAKYSTEQLPTGTVEARQIKLIRKVK